jgi:hypothetical protein
MPKPESEQTNRADGSASSAVPPSIRLVHAFRDAVEAAPPREDRADEVFVVKGLLIAANASFSALSHYADLWHEGTYGKMPSAEAGEEQVVLEGYEAWLDGADPLLDRLLDLPVTQGSPLDAGKERLLANHMAARAAWDDARERRRVEQQALRTDRLIELTGRLEPRQASYDDEGSTP